MPKPSEQRNPVLILAPIGRDALLIGAALEEVEVPAEVCSGMDEFAARLHDGAAAGILAQEALSAAAIEALARSFERQPPWSDIPLILMTTRRFTGPGITELIDLGLNLTLLERPVHKQTLITAVNSALRQRRRQYELRDRLAEQQRTEERLRQTQKLESLGILAGGIAHDFNNLLTGIIGNVSLALESEPSQSTNKRFLEDALNASERAADLTRQLLAYSGKGRFAIQLLDLSDAVRDINALLQTSISKNVHVILNLSPALPRIEADATQIQQIVMNLIINAAEAIGAETDGLVVVETGSTMVDSRQLKTMLAADGAAPGEYVYLEVRDTGCGIDKEALAKIFDPFFTTKFMGRGLGLAAVLGIVRGHNGALKVESFAGRGTSFRVLFPAVARAARTPAVEPKRKDLSGSGTVLVVDDEAVVRQIAQNTLESWGYRVLLAENGQIALDLFAKHAAEIGLVLLDLTMPVMNGEQTFERLKRIQPGVRVILTSGYDESDAMGRFDGAGLAGFVQKPFTAAKLAQAVKRVFEQTTTAAGAGRAREQTL